jgi:eukaryotic-like serine/threonine-protein kinase
MDPRQLGKYTLLAELGGGGFGTVYKATDPIGRTVAIKILKPGWVNDPGIIARFKLEALAAGKLFHAHIATILDFEEENGQPFIVMRYVDGQSMDNLINKKGKLDWDLAVDYLKEVAEALDFAHKRGFIHRDIKPANILVSETEGAVLTDFGLVKAAQTSGLSSSDVLMGSPSYIPPEVWEGKKASPATDIYALACAFYEMITGNKLFSGDSSPQIMTRHVLEGPRFPSVWPKTVPQGIEHVLGKALMREPGGRFSSASAFASAIDELKKAPIQQNPLQTTPAVGQHLVKERSRSSYLIIPAVVVSLLCVLACSGVLLFLFIRQQASQRTPTREYPTSTSSRIHITASSVWDKATQTPDGNTSIPIKTEFLSTSTLEPTGTPVPPASPTPLVLISPTPTRIVISPTSTPEVTWTPTASPTNSPVPDTPTPALVNENTFLGNSYGGRAISMATIGSPGGVVILVVGSIDGTQTDTRDILVNLINTYTENTSLVPSGTVFYLIPSINPDGNANNSRYNDDNVDLNRNWGTVDWTTDPPVPGYPNGKPGAGGSSPFSEPETSSLRRLMLKLKDTSDQVILFILHSTVSRTQGEVFAGYNTQDSQFDSESKRLAQLLGNLLGYTYSTTWDYNTPGDAIDWSVEYGIPSVDIIWPKASPPSPMELIDAFSYLVK